MKQPNKILKQLIIINHYKDRDTLIEKSPVTSTPIEQTAGTVDKIL